MLDITEYILGFAGAILGILYKHNDTRITKMESKMEKMITKDDIRELLSDKIDPLKEDIQEIKQKLDKKR